MGAVLCKKSICEGAPGWASCNRAQRALPFTPMLFTSHRTQTKVLVLIFASLAAACGTPGAATSDGRRGEPLEFERLQVGSVYGIGSHFSSDGISFAVESFGEGLGNAEISTLEAQALPPKQKQPSAKTLRLSHATLRCRGRSTNLLEFDFVDNGGSIALEFAGKKRSAADFIALDGAQIGALRIAVSETSTAGVRRGRVSVVGAIDKFAIAGADLELADLRLSR